MELKLPSVVMTKMDVLRLNRELEVFEQYVNQLKKRGQDIKSAPLPKMSSSLEGLILDNKIDPRDDASRTSLVAYVAELKKSAPVVHLSFAVDPPAAVLVKLVEWFRLNVNPLTVLQVGVQPNIAGGCIVRTTNRYFDFSLRQHFKKNIYQLFEAIDKPSSASRVEVKKVIPTYSPVEAEVKK